MEDSEVDDLIKEVAKDEQYIEIMDFARITFKMADPDKEPKGKGKGKGKGKK